MQLQVLNVYSERKTRNSKALVNHTVRACRVMSFVGGGGNIAIATALLRSSFVYSILNIK